ncbi:MAG: TIR domain-containing protein [Clostridiales bacterium]|nr:TIR domain-containing protein [Clostridiales bacterium]
MLEYVRAYEGDGQYIFISYAHKDSEIAIPIINELYKHKYRVWYDEGINPGSEWPKNIEWHLQKASLILVFISENSLASPNCENEIIFALKQDKKIITVCLDGTSKHPLLSRVKDFSNNDGLMGELIKSEYLSEELIGNGIDGYQYSIDKTRSYNRWNIALVLAAFLAIGFSIALYGLYNGWFDALLPAKQPIVEIVAPTAQPQEGISIDSNLLGSVLPVQFSAEDEKTAVYEKLGWPHPYEMTYKDLLEMDSVTQLDICNEPIYDIKFATFLPNLEIITLFSSRITDLSPLIECPKLQVVQVTADMLPITLPTPRNFEVEITGHAINEQNTTLEQTQTEEPDEDSVDIETPVDEQQTQMPTEEIEIKEPIPPFESEAQEILQLTTPQSEFADMDELIDSIIANYEVVHITDFEQEITFFDSTVKKVDDGYRFSGPPPNYQPAKCIFQKGAVENYFDTPDNYYAVLARYKLHNSHDVGFGISTRFGGMSYGHYANIYPAVDISGDSPDSIINKNWNNYIYELGEWAYVLISATKYSQVLCYSWAENDVNNYTYFTAYGTDSRYDHDWWGDDWYRYSVGAWDGEMIISDFWIYSYEELKR